MGRSLSVCEVMMRRSVLRPFESFNIILDDPWVEKDVHGKTV